MKNTKTHSNIERLCTIYFIINRFNEVFPHILDIIKQHFYKIDYKTLRYLEINHPKYQIYLYYFKNIDCMLTIINNINKLLNVSLILPNIYDTNLIIEGMYRLKPNKNKVIKSIEIKLNFGFGPIPTKSSHLIISGFEKKHYYKINYEDLKQFTPIVDKLLWKNMGIGVKFNYVESLKISYRKNFYETSNIEDYYHFKILYTDDTLYDLLISPTFDFCYYVYINDAPAYREIQYLLDGYCNDDFYSTVISYFPKHCLYRLNKYSLYNRTSCGKTYLDKIICDSNKFFNKCVFPFPFPDTQGYHNE